MGIQPIGLDAGIVLEKVDLMVMMRIRYGMTRAILFHVPNATEGVDGGDAGIVKFALMSYPVMRRVTHAHSDNPTGSNLAAAAQAAVYHD